MKKLVLKEITAENLPILKEMCTNSFETERGIVPDEIMPENGMGSEFEETLSDKNVDGLAIYDGEILVGGAAIVNKEEGRRVLELFFIDENKLGKGYGTRAWKAIENYYPDTRVWETFTPISLKQNLAFYVNNCGFHITRIEKDDMEWDCIFEKVMDIKNNCN